MLPSSAGTLLLRVSGTPVLGPAAEGRFASCAGEWFGLWATLLHQQSGQLSGASGPELDHFQFWLGYTKGNSGSLSGRDITPAQLFSAGERRWLCPLSSFWVLWVQVGRGGKGSASGQGESKELVLSLR